MFRIQIESVHDYSTQLERNEMVAKYCFRNQEILSVYVNSGYTSQDNLPSDKSVGKILQQEII